MTAPLRHRGPDGWGTYLSPNVALGHTRLAIVDPSGGRQPLSTDRTVVSYNGEIYNHIELREALKREGVRFRTSCDTEVLLRLFEREGPSCLKKLNGQFAFLIWDKAKETLTVGRDRYGMRPLYVIHFDNRFYFSSEMKSFDAIEGFDRRFHPERLLEHGLLWNTLGDSTVFKGIRSVEAGTYEVFGPDGTFRRTRYYEIGDTGEAEDALPDIHTAMDRFTNLLQESVDLRLRSDVPVGAYLSGGIDSSAIAYLTKERKQDDFQTFSVGFEHKSFDESAFQKEVAEHLSSRHEVIDISLDAIEQNFIDAVYHAERPIFRTAPVPLFLLSSCVRGTDIKVVLTGEGADEILFGYDVFKELKILERWRADPASDQISQLIAQLYPHLSHYADPTRLGMIRMYYQEFLEEVENDLVGLNMRVSNNKIIARYLNEDLGVGFDKEQLLGRLQATLPADFSRWGMLQKNSYLEIRTLLQGYLLSSQGDRMALGHGIEGRYPFLDHRVVDTLFHYPDHYKLNGFSQKHILRESFRGKVPSSVIDRPKRPYMAPDLAAFFRDGGLTPTARRFLSDEAIEESGLFSIKYVKRLVRKYERRMPEEIGYRDNMLIVFILSAQIADYFARNPLEATLDEGERRVRIVDYVDDDLH